MIKIINKNECSGCHACTSVCPSSAIEMAGDAEGFWYPKVDPLECAECGLCLKVCPLLNRCERPGQPKAYACISLNETVRRESSSGGVFTLLAQGILSDNGVVFGAGFDRQFDVVHSFSDSLEGVGAFRGSKYVQSRIGESFIQARGFLEAGRPVLFSGTPCQVAGLKSYLRKDYPGLVCLDNICHGVPSPKAWRRYLAGLEERAASSVSRVSFRMKSRSWKSYQFYAKLDNGTEISQDFTKNPYMRAFLKDICPRPSCHACGFKGNGRKSDITLADFWGIQNVLPAFDDDKGTSLILVSTAKGQQALDEIGDKMRCKEVGIDAALESNQAAVRSAAQHKDRAEFFRQLDSVPFETLTKKYCSDSTSFRIKKTVRRFAGALIKRLPIVRVRRT